MYIGMRLSSKEVAIVTRKANPAGTYRKLKRQGRPALAFVDLAGKKAAVGKGLGIRRVKLSPPGTTD